MAETTHFGDSEVDTDVLDGAEHAYPRDRLYVKIAIVLAVLTALEVGVHSFPELFGGPGSPGYVAALLVTMFAKFWAVGYFFMHLKWDNKLLGRVFYIGFILAILVYVAVMAMFRLFSQGGSGMMS
jgi:cytochrome c oxidase subunit IV